MNLNNLKAGALSCKERGIDCPVAPDNLLSMIAAVEAARPAMEAMENSESEMRDLWIDHPSRKMNAAAIAGLRVALEAVEKS
jgi:hypothetical protein